MPPLGMRVFYDHQVFSLQNAGGISRYFYEIMRFMATVPDVQTELLLGIGGTVYPFRSLPPSKARVTQLRESLPPGMLRYVVNEILGNFAALSRGTMDIYHLTLYMRMPMVRARRVIATLPDELHQMQEYIEEKLAGIGKRFGNTHWDRVIATSATASAVVCAVNRIPRMKRDQADRMRASTREVRRLYK